jgi:hypothetical protein
MDRARILAYITEVSNRWVSHTGTNPVLRGALKSEDTWRQGLFGRTRENDDGRVFALLDHVETLFNTA